MLKKIRSVLCLILTVYFSPRISAANSGLTNTGLKDLGLTNVTENEDYVAQSSRNFDAYPDDQSRRSHDPDDQSNHDPDDHSRRSHDPEDERDDSYKFFNLNPPGQKRGGRHHSDESVWHGNVGNVDDEPDNSRKKDDEGGPDGDWPDGYKGPSSVHVWHKPTRQRGERGDDYDDGRSRKRESDYQYVGSHFQNDKGEFQQYSEPNPTNGEPEGSAESGQQQQQQYYGGGRDPRDDRYQEPYNGPRSLEDNRGGPQQQQDNDFFRPFGFPEDEQQQQQQPQENFQPDDDSQNNGQASDLFDQLFFGQPTANPDVQQSSQDRQEPVYGLVQSFEPLNDLTDQNFVLIAADAAQPDEAEQNPDIRNSIEVLDTKQTAAANENEVQNWKSEKLQEQTSKWNDWHDVSENTTPKPMHKYMARPRSTTTTYKPYVAPVTRATTTPAPTQPPRFMGRTVPPIMEARKISTTESPFRRGGYSPAPQPFTLAQRCDPGGCKLPDCFCGGHAIPGGLRLDQVPQMVLITFDDSVNDINFNFYKDLFARRRINPNGCPITGTFYVSHEWTDYAKVYDLHSNGHEIAAHSVSHSDGSKFKIKRWQEEIGGMRNIFYNLANIPPSEIQGMRAPFLQSGGNRMFAMLYDQNFTYDSSLPTHMDNPPLWPYTLDYAMPHECTLPPCPTRSFPGLWEVPLIMWSDEHGGKCPMADGCRNPTDVDSAYNNLRRNFEKHYNTNRAPFGIYFHYAWFTIPHHKEGFMKFMEELAQKDDVYVVSTSQMLNWVRNPTPLNRIHEFRPWQCQKGESRMSSCPQPVSCELSFSGGDRTLKTCNRCPLTYPWLFNLDGMSPKSKKVFESR